MILGLLMHIYAPSYMSHSVADVLVAAEGEKKKKYLTAAEVYCTTFSPFVLAVDGALEHDDVLFMRRLRSCKTFFTLG